ncbi:MAG: FecR family protein, partial [Gammaproteobacteria bacterium]|nr:FecR family protein [Gammaproteobacteria bacterium]
MRNTAFLGACLAWIFAAGVAASAAAADCDPKVAQLTSREGSVDVRRHRSGSWVDAPNGTSLCFGDRIRVGRDSRAAVVLNNDTILRLDAGATLVLPEPDNETFSFVELLDGALHLISRIKGRLEVRTPFVNAGLEGTEFVVRVDDSQAIVAVIEGRVAVSNRHGALRLVGGALAADQA